MTMEPLVAALGRRRSATRIIGAAAPWLATGLGAAAASAGLVRLFVPGGHPVWQAVLAAGILAPLWPAWRAWRDRDPAWVLAGHLDRLAGTRGLAMAAAERPAGGWAAHLTVPLAGVRLPPVSLRPLLAPALAAVAL
ncbi:MAG: hypothetical protein RLZZ127_3246, partial [Planctomycetota bacterium]